MIQQEDNEQVTSIFELNSQAMFQLQEGRYDVAIATLQRAVQRLRIETQNPTGFHRSPHMTGYGSQAGNAVLEDVSIVSSPVDRDQLDLEEPSTAVANCIGDTLLFRPFEMVFSSVYLDYEGLRGISLTWAFVLYNLALCHHHRELKNGTMKKEALLYALELYRAGLHVIQAAMGDGRPQDIILLILAIYNNMGHLYSHLRMLDRSEECITEMRGLLLRIPQNVRVTIPHPEYAFFQLGAMAVPEDIFNKAPAA